MTPSSDRSCADVERLTLLVAGGLDRLADLEVVAGDVDRLVDLGAFNAVVDLDLLKGDVSSFMLALAEVSLKDRLEEVLCPDSLPSPIGLKLFLALADVVNL